MEPVTGLVRLDRRSPMGSADPPPLRMTLMSLTCRHSLGADAAQQGSTDSGPEAGRYGLLVTHSISRNFQSLLL